MVTVSSVLMSSVGVGVIREGFTDAVVDRQQKRPSRDPCERSNHLRGSEAFDHGFTLPI
jgi:hypothetical protein